MHLEVYTSPTYEDGAKGPKIMYSRLSQLRLDTDDMWELILKYHRPGAA